MSIIHLSDSDIQEYLDRQSNKEKVESHILSCEECAIAIAEYESLYATLAVDEAPQLSVNFVDATMDIVREETMLAESNKGFYLYSFMSMVCAIIFMKYYAGYDFSAFKFELPTMNNFIADWTIFDAAATLYQTSTSTVNVLLFAGLILLIVALADSVISRKAMHKVSSFSF